MYIINAIPMGLFSRHIQKGMYIMVLVMALVGCTSDEKHPVPVVPVEFRINTEFQFIELNSIGGWVYVTGGFGGIVIYRFSVDEFMAFDRACPVHPYNEEARVRVEDPPIAYCPVCDSQFLLIDGTPFSGPAKYPLLQYHAIYREPYLSVSN
ncbi:MAG: hypothetical protein ACOC12_00045 [Bacteroidota bacterium]